MPCVDPPTIPPRFNSTYDLLILCGGANKSLCSCRAGSQKAAVKTITEHTKLKLDKTGYMTDGVTSYVVAVQFGSDTPTHEEFMEGKSFDPNYAKIIKPFIPESTH